MERLIVLGVAILAFLLPGCEEETSDYTDTTDYLEKIDYRDKYCGDWYFTTLLRSFSMEDENSSTDTIYYDGSIWYEKEDTIHINYRENRTIEFAINDTGGIFIDAYYPVHGMFSDEDHMNFHLYSGGRGGGTEQSVSGVKRY